jgi:hypothetical protein
VAEEAAARAAEAEAIRDRFKVVGSEELSAMRHRVAAEVGQWERERAQGRHTLADLQHKVQAMEAAARVQGLL